MVNQAVTTESLKAELVSYLKHLQVNLMSGNNVKHLHQTGQSLLYNVKENLSENTMSKVSQVNKRKKLFGM